MTVAELKELKAQLLLFMCQHPTFPAVDFKDFLYQKQLSYTSARPYQLLDKDYEKYLKKTKTVKGTSIYELKKELPILKDIFDSLPDKKHKLKFVHTKYFNNCMKLLYPAIIPQNFHNVDDKILSAIVHLIYFSPTALELLLSPMLKDRLETSLLWSLETIASSDISVLEANLQEYFKINVSLNNLDIKQRNLMWVIYYCVVIDYLSDWDAMGLVDTYRLFDPERKEIRQARIDALPSNVKLKLKDIEEFDQAVEWVPSRKYRQLHINKKKIKWKKVEGGAQNKYDADIQ
jgi:hypothetical protein